MPANAGIQRKFWTPAFAGVTDQSYLGCHAVDLGAERSGYRAEIERRGHASYILRSRFTLPLRIFALSSAHSGTFSIQRTPGGLSTNG